MKRAVWLSLVFLEAAAVVLPASGPYRFSYEMRGAARGRILWIIPYRAFYLSRASAEFQPASSTNGARLLVLDRIDRTGVMLRTTGFSGRTLVILTADADLETGIRNGKRLWREWRGKLPYYPRFVRREKDFQFCFFSPPAGGIRFLRSQAGRHANADYAMDVRYRYDPEKLGIDFNLYRIMREMLLLYNHEIHPPREAFSLFSGWPMPGCWVSPPLDFSAQIGTIVGLASRFAGSLKGFGQQKPFQLLYRLEKTLPGRIQVNGSAHPHVPIWGNFRIVNFNRVLTVETHSGRILRDELRVEIAKSRHGKLTVFACLEALSPQGNP